MPQHNAVLIFSQTPNIDFSNSDGTFPVLPWEDIDALYTAMIGDFVKNTCQMPGVDVLLYRNPNELSDDFFLPYQQRLQLFDLNDAPLSEQIQQAIENAFSSGYQNVVVVLDNHTMVTRAVLRRVLSQLGYEDDCLVVGPTYDEKCYLVGMKMNHSRIFDISNGEPLHKSKLLMKQICEIDSMVFPLNPLYSLYTPINLMNLMKHIDALDRSNVEFPTKTYAVFKMFEKKYKLKKLLQ